MVSLTPVKEAFTIVIANGGEFLSGVVGTAGAHSKTVKAVRNSSPESTMPAIPASPMSLTLVKHQNN